MTGSLRRPEPGRHPQHRLRRDRDRQRHQRRRATSRSGATGSRCSTRRTRRRRWGRAVPARHRRVGLAPRTRSRSPGYFRTLVLGTGDDPAALDAGAFDAAILAGRMAADDRALHRARRVRRRRRGRARGPDPCDRRRRDARPRRSTRSRSRSACRRASWVPVDEVRVVVNGEVRPELTFDAATNPKLKKRPKHPRLARQEGASSASTPWWRSRSPGEDLFLLVEAGAKLDPLPAPDPDASLVVPGYVSLAFTNPVFVDVGGDGFDPPGVSARARPAPWRRCGRPAGARPSKRRRSASAARTRPSTASGSRPRRHGGPSADSLAPCGASASPSCSGLRSRSARRGRRAPTG